jgi:hypothetical protein
VSKIPPEKKDRVIELLKKGERPDQIASELGVPIGSVIATKANLNRDYSGKKEMLREAQRKANEACLKAKRCTKKRLTNEGYKCMDFDTKRGYEYKGIVDLIAVKRDKKELDLLTIILFQVKGGERPKVSEEDLARLRKAASHIKIHWNYAKQAGATVEFGKDMPRSR